MKRIKYSLKIYYSKLKLIILEEHKNNNQYDKKLLLWEEIDK
jgi:hypothetical protein